MTISFKGAHFPKDVILHAVFFYLRYGVSYRDLEEIMAERCVDLDHATLNRRVGKYAGLVSEAARYRKCAVDRSWCMDETYVKVKGEWVYQGFIVSHFFFPAQHARRQQSAGRAVFPRCTVAVSANSPRSLFEIREIK